MENIHGGDIYRNQVQLDFSVNMNPLGVPKAVIRKLQEAVNVVHTYPDIQAEALYHSVANMLEIQEEKILFGNGASELFMAIIHGISPKRIVIPVPSFYGYLHAAESSNAEIIYCGQTRETLLKALTEETDLLFLANPNNPTGETRGKAEMKALLSHCKERGIVVVLDECFVEFCEEDLSMLTEIMEYPDLVVVRAFTKLFSIPGVRLGYLVCGNVKLLGKIRRQIPEWNLSVFAQKAGSACAKEQEFVRKTALFVKKEREYLEEGLQKLGIRTFPSKANFLLVYSRKPLYEELLKRGILIRDCRNFRGLTKGYYRIAVKTREENEALLRTIGEIQWKEEK